MKLGSCGATVLVVAALAGCSADLLTASEETPASARVGQLGSRDDVPAWAVRYGEEFWRRAPPDPTAVARTSNVPIGDVIDRVSHAVEWRDSLPTVRARTYSATFDGSELRFAPRPARATDDAGPELRVHTKRISSGSTELFRDDASSLTWSVFGNTVQAELAPSAGLVEHREARADGVEVTWVLNDRTALHGDVQIDLAIYGLAYTAQDDRGAHYADDRGGSRVRIGNAVLVDASGKQWPVATEIIDGGARWHLDQATLATATFPVALDPNVSPELVLDDPILTSGSTAQPFYWSIASNGQDFLVVWLDSRSRAYAYDWGYDAYMPQLDVYGARIDASGVLLDPGGFQLSTGTGQHNTPSVASIGTDYLVVWEDWRESPDDQSWPNSDIYGTRVTAAGVVQDPDNIAISTVAGNQQWPAVSTNGSDYLVAWSDLRPPSTALDVYCTRVSADGVVASADGVQVSTHGGAYAPRITSNGTDYLVAWADSRNWAANGYDLYGARISAAGIVDETDIAISTAGSDQLAPTLASDGADYLVAWRDSRNGDANIYGARVTSSGTVLDSAGFVVTDAASDQGPPSLAFDGRQYFASWATSSPESGAQIYGTTISVAGAVAHDDGVPLFQAGTGSYWPLVAWNGTEYFLLWFSRYEYVHEAYGARLNVDGTAIDPYGIELAVGVNTEGAVGVASNGDDYLVAWADDRNGGPRELDIYGVRVSESGEIKDPTAIQISSAPGPQQYPAVTSDGTDYFVIWNNASFTGWSSISGTRVTAEGVVEDPAGIALSGYTAELAPAVVASSGTEYLAVWEDARDVDTGYSIYGTRVSGAGVVQDPGGIGIGLGNSPSIASNGSNYFVAWTYAPTPQTRNLLGARVTTGGIVQDSTDIALDVAGDVWSPPPSVASNGTDYLVAWIKAGVGSHVVCSAVTSAGLVRDPGGVEISSMGWNLRVSVASDGVGYFAAWASINPDPVSNIYGATLDADGTVTVPDRLVIAGDGESESDPKVASTGSSYLVAYTSSMRAAARLVSDADYPTDSDECALQTDNCSSNATCSNRYVGFVCTCNTGYTGDGVTCMDIDECALGTDTCAAEATCMNADGGYSCACEAGYSGDGHSCTDIDECALGTASCAPQATCANISGGFNCACNAGYAGDGHACVDIDECAEPTNNCSPNATCTNSDGTFSCACDAGFTGDGIACTPIADDSEGSGGGCQATRSSFSWFVLAFVAFALRGRRRTCM